VVVARIHHNQVVLRAGGAAEDLIDDHYIWKVDEKVRVAFDRRARCQSPGCLQGGREDFLRKLALPLGHGNGAQEGLEVVVDLGQALAYVIVGRWHRRPPDKRILHAQGLADVEELDSVVHALYALVARIETARSVNNPLEDAQEQKVAILSVVLASKIVGLQALDKFYETLLPNMPFECRHVVCDRFHKPLHKEDGPCVLAQCLEHNVLQDVVPRLSTQKFIFMYLADQHDKLSMELEQGDGVASINGMIPYKVEDMRFNLLASASRVRGMQDLLQSRLGIGAQDVIHVLSCLEALEEAGIKEGLRQGRHWKMESEAVV